MFPSSVPCQQPTSLKSAGDVGGGPALKGFLRSGERICGQEDAAAMASAVPAKSATGVVPVLTFRVDEECCEDPQAARSKTAAKNSLP